MNKYLTALLALIGLVAVVAIAELPDNARTVTGDTNAVTATAADGTGLNLSDYTDDIGIQGGRATNIVSEHFFWEEPASLQPPDEQLGFTIIHIFSAENRVMIKTWAVPLDFTNAGDVVLDVSSATGGSAGNNTNIVKQVIDVRFIKFTGLLTTSVTLSITNDVSFENITGWVTNSLYTLDGPTVQSNDLISFEIHRQESDPGDLFDGEMGVLTESKLRWRTQ